MPFISDYVLDNGLATLDDGTLVFHICNAEPTSYANVASVTLGNKSAPIVTTPVDATPTGRKGTIQTFTGGTVTTDGTALAWALVNTAASRLAASGGVTSQVVTSGNTFSLTAAIDIRIPDAA